MAATKALQAFTEGMLLTDLVDSEDFVDFDARRLRYDILWAFYENTAYRNIHKWAEAYRNRHGLGKHTRNIYSPAYRLAEFHVGTIWGGRLDKEAGNKGAIPVEVGKKADAGLQESLAALWSNSNWSINKDIVTLWGATLGDVAIRIVDDVDAGTVYLEPVHPSFFRDVEINSRGYVKSYVFEQEREDLQGKMATYTESVYRGENGEVIFETLRNGREYAWDGVDWTWSEDYTFIPLVFIRHRNVGLPFGWAEMQPARSKISELDDQASLVNDQIRKSVNAPWLFNFPKPKAAVVVSGSAASSDRPQPGREEVPALYIDKPDARGQALVSNLSIAESLQAIDKLIGELERDFPELQMDIWSSDAASGKALDAARQRVEQKVDHRRASYDSDFVRACQMAVAIGGFRNYPGYEGFGLESYKAGKLDFQVADRPVFIESAGAETDRKQKVWSTASAASREGVAIETVLRDFGYTDDQLSGIGTQKLAGIRLKQEDKVPPTKQ